MAVDAFLSPCAKKSWNINHACAPALHDHEGGGRVYVVDGPAIRRHFERTNFDREEEVKRFALLRRPGVDEELRKLASSTGPRAGDQIRFEFGIDATDPEHTFVQKFYKSYGTLSGPKRRKT